MTIELAAMLIAGVIASISAYLAYTKETGRGRRFAVAMMTLFAAIAGLMALEQYQRAKSMATLAEEVDRKWIALQDAYVEGIEFEMMTPDGQVRLSDLLNDAQKVRFQVDGVDFHLEGEHAGQSAIELSRVMSINNLSRNGRLGIAEFEVGLSRDQKAIEKFKTVDCFASHFITEHIVAQTSSNQTLDEVCSATVILALPNTRMPLRTIFSSPRISLTITDGGKLTCMGICKEGLVVSVKLFFRDVGPMFRTAVEVSPFLYLAQPSLVSQQKKTAEFALSGDSVSKLAKSHFLQSFGYKNQDHFPITQGIFDFLLRHLTGRTETMKLIEVVWTTNPSPSLHSLTNAVNPERRASLAPMMAGEWCGFGDRPFCWYVFDIFAGPGG